MTRTPPVLLLVLLASVVAELSIGDLPFTATGLVGFLFLLPIYGAGALPAREVVRRRVATGWPAIALLGVAYGIVEEGIALQSLFSPTMYNGIGPAWGVRVLGVNGVYLVVQLLNHAVWSVTVPIALTDLAFPHRRGNPLLGRLGLAVTAVVFCLGVGLTAAGRGTRDPGYSTPPALLLAVGVAVAALVVAALLVSRRRPVRMAAAARAPRPSPRSVSAWLAGSAHSRSWRGRRTRTPRSCTARSRGRRSRAVS
ncbi:hypothetical protein [Actinopolymorpha rutila]|uniref:Uncharacterized protein n=1 Tax=Actinopolymorpha rutila TaxID=446787 RepID=A0A852ZNK1_9ACTN|nr:hypothetical protein [Actinopolymorpha rutila]NYH93478.1 hypothetical protein [Actinopolymorpha rutila]